MIFLRNEITESVADNNVFLQNSISFFNIRLEIRLLAVIVADYNRCYFTDLSIAYDILFDKNSLNLTMLFKL